MCTVGVTTASTVSGCDKEKRVATSPLLDVEGVRIVVKRSTAHYGSEREMHVRVVFAGALQFVLC